MRGSKAYARRHADELRALVLLDFVADKDLSIPREAGSDAKLWARLRRGRQARRGRAARSRTSCAARSPTTTRRSPPAACRAIDLIDFDFPCWHETCDDMSAVSASSLDRSGEAVLELLRTWR